MALPRAWALLISIAGLASAAGPSLSSAASLVYSVRTWEGEFSSRNVAGRGNAASPGLAISPVRSRIYIMRDDGTHRQEVPFAGDRMDAPMSDPDGHWIYFQSEVAGNGCIYRCQPDGSHLTKLAPVPALGSAWQSVYGLFLSMDGSCFTYTATDGKIGHSVLARADGTRPQVLIPNEG